MAVLAITLLSFNRVNAQNPHFQSVSINEANLTISGKIVGMGKQGFVDIDATAEISYKFDCYNPANHEVKPFTNVRKTSTVTGEYTTTKNGAVAFSIQLQALSNDDLAAEFCPNRLWNIQNISSALDKSSVMLTTNIGLSWPQ